MLCKRKGVKIVEAEICPDHVHMLVEIPPSISVSYFVGYLKGKSTLMIFERHANLKYKYGNRHFWCRGYYVDTVGKNAKKIQEYIANQLQDDLESVSYTHLDVYKRQKLIFATGYFPNLVHGAALEEYESLLFLPL